MTAPTDSRATGAERSGALGAQHFSVPPFRWSAPVVAALFTAVFTIAFPLASRAVGTVAWGGCFCGERGDAWPVGVTVMVWQSAIAVVVGTVGARRLLGRAGQEGLLGTLWGGVAGSMFALPFTAALAGQAQVDGVGAPGLSMAMSIPVGAVLGVVVGAVALRHPALTMALWSHVGWIVALGFLSVVLSWGDDVRQSVPLGAAWVGGPPADAAAIERTAHELVISILKGVAVVGPAVAAATITWLSIRARYGTKMAIVAGMLGPVLVLVSYLLRPDALAGDNSEWLSLALRVIMVALIACGITALLGSLPGRPTGPRSDMQHPLVNVRINPGND